MWMDADSDEERLDEECDGAGDVGYDTAPDERWDLGADRVYWRRRFLILCAGVIALGVCAWMIPGVNAPSKRVVAQARQSAAALGKQQVPSAVAYGNAWARPTPAAPSAPPSAAPASTAPAKLAKTKRPAPSGHPSPAPGAAGPSPCAPSSIVLSLFTSEPRYARGARPAFSVYAVSTKAAACTLSFGAGAIQVIVTRGGRVVWDSAACRPAPAKAARFTLGVPQVLTLTWNPRATRPSGCGGSLRAGESGTFDAVAMSHGQASPVRAFKIAG
jgi:hypothetical protein